MQAAHRLSGSDDYVADFNAIATHLDPKEPRYIIHKLQDPSRHAFISYVPDGAHVRKKMLYASSANTIQRQLGGSERFPDNIFWTDVSEVSAEGWKEHQNHTSAAHPITSEEAAEQAAADEMLLSGDSASTSARRSHVESRLSTPLAAAEQHGEVLDAALTQLSVPSGTPWVRVLRINDGEKVYVHSEHNGAHNVVELIDSSAPQYTLVDHDGSGKVHFVYTCPSGSSLRQKMLYSFKKQPAARALGSLIDITTVVSNPRPMMTLFF